MFSIIIPVYNESQSLPAVLSELMDICDFSKGEIIIVDDSENSLTQNSCHSFIDNKTVKYIHRGQRLGLADAVITGFEQAQGEWLLCMDGDGSHDPQAVAKIIELSSDSDLELIIGCRYISGGELDRQWPWGRRFLSRLFCLLVWPLTRVKDPMSGCFAVKKEMYLNHKNSFEGLGYKILLEILVKSGCRKIREIPLKFRLRDKGVSKVTLKIMLESIYHICKLYKFGVLFKKKQ